MKLFLIDSISSVTQEMRDQLVVTGSHGGISAAHLALAHPPRLVAFNDAGGGLDAAGVAALRVLNDAGVAACTVSHASARIGEAASTLATGRITAVNDLAKSFGIRAGEAMSVVVERLREPS